MHIPYLGAAIMTAVVFVGVSSGTSSAARFHDPSLQAPSLVEDVACRTVRSRVVRPGGAVVYRTKRVCEPGWTSGSGRNCRTVRERVERPGGTVFRTVRRCG